MYPPSSQINPTLLAEFTAAHEAVREKVAIQRHEVTRLTGVIESLTAERVTLKSRTEHLTMASAVLRELVAVVADRNLRRVEELVNTALKTIFFDQNLEFKIVSGVARNQTSYRIVLLANGVEGNINSFGGGVWAVVAFVLKAIFNLLANRHPFLVFDESLAYLSEKYIGHASAFIKELSHDLKIPVVLVTHQPAFAEAADRVYEARATGNHGSVAFDLRQNAPVSPDRAPIPSPFAGDA